MRSISVRLFCKWSLLVAVAALSTLPAVAQLSKGEFTITKEAHWGTVVLPAGSYAFSVEHHASELLLLRPKAGGGGHFIMANSVSHTDSPTSDRLTLERHGSEWYVTSMVLDDLGETLIFKVPTESTSTKLVTIARK